MLEGMVPMGLDGARSPTATIPGAMGTHSTLYLIYLYKYHWATTRMHQFIMRDFLRLV